MNYELAKQLKDAGFPYKEGETYYPIFPDGKRNVGFTKEEMCKIVTLSELIEACNPFKSDEFYLTTELDGWRAFYRYYGFFEHNDKFKKEDGIYEVEPSVFGSTPEEAVANLWLELNKK